MLSNEVIEALADIVATRFEEVNTYTLKTIAKQLKKIKNHKDLRPTEINKLVNLLKYGGDYDKIVKKLAEVSKLSRKDIDKIFKNTAKKNQEFAKKFYDYRNKKFIPFEENVALQRQVEAIADITKNSYRNLGNTRAIGFTRIVGGKKIFVPLKKMYQEVIDRGVISLQQGQTTLYEELRNITKELSSSGLRTVDFESGYHRRIDSQARMNLMDGIRQLSNQINLTFGEEFGADGVEITVHEYPAPDHALVQGRQFTNEEFYKFQNDEDSVSYDINKKNHRGIKFPATSEETKHDRRSISQYNCYHRAFPIILGIDDPIYSDKELQDIIDENNEGFDIDGKHYTKYQGTQMQRKIETEIRKAKDEQIMAREIEDKEAIKEAQDRITKLNKKYKELSTISGLSTRDERKRVSGYRRVSTK